MDSKLCLSLISLIERSIDACSLISAFLWTLLFSVLFINPSFANDLLNNNAYEANATLSTTTNSSFLAQTIAMPKDGKAISETISDCNAQNKFMDDGILTPLYNDSIARMDTISICPNTQSQGLRVEFNAFELADGDTLSVYDGDLAAFKKGSAPFIAKASGVGVSKAFGGWLQSACSPGINPSGCLTFVFHTNGDFVKSIGWEAWLTCIERDIVLTPPSISNPILDCDKISFVQTIGSATVTASCGSITNDSTFVTIRNASGTVCIDTCLSKNQNMAITEAFAIGSYIVTYRLKGDVSKSAITYFAISAPSLVCNDELTIPVGSACGVSITPDMILENPCDTISDTMYYQISIKDNTGKIIAQGTGKAGDYPILTKEQLGQCSNTNFKVEITRTYFDGLNLTVCNNGKQTATCSAEVRFIDNSAPLFTQSVSTDTVFACEPVLTEAGLKLTKPTAFDNCAEVAVVFQGTQKIGITDNCEEATYLVTWVASDNCGNSRTLIDTVRVMRPGTDKIIKAPNAILSCGEDDISAVYNLKRTGVPSLALGIQQNGVFVPTDTVPLSTENYVCSYILSKEDKQFTASCGVKFYRYWTLVDWCGAKGPEVIDTQFIEFKDTLAPVLQCSNYNTLAKAEKITLSHFDCSKNIGFALPTATDNCDLLPEVAEFIVEQYENDGWWKLGNNLNQSGALATGTYRVGYRAYDQCVTQIKEDSCYRYFILEDKTKPSAVCTNKLTVSISNDYARIAATDIDAGSWDACGIESILVRRAFCDSPNEWQGAENSYVKSRLANKLDSKGWSPYLDFSCCDMQTTVNVELLVIDNNGNYNFCWMAVTTEDKINPVCVNLPNQWDYCDNFHNGELGADTDTDEDKQFDNTEWLPLEDDLADAYNAKYGDPYAACVDNLTCQQLTLEQQYQLIDLACGVYKVKRRYRVKDGTGNASNWAEQYINIEYRPDWAITLPTDWVGTCGDGVPEEELIIDNGSCDLMAYEAYDQKFEIVNDACFKVIRTYHIINWCYYKAGDTPININRISDVTGDVVNNQRITSAKFTGASYLTYTQILKVDDTDAPVITVAAVSDCIEETDACSTEKTFSASAVDCNEASNENLDFHWEIFENELSKGSGFTKTFNWVVQPNSNYRVKWKVSDKCGNNAWVEHSYIFKDCVNPTAYCLDGLALELGSNKEVDIWATDFNINSADNCTPKDKLDFKIWHQSLAIEAPTDFSGVQNLPTSISLNCTYIGLQTVYVYIIDQAGNYGFCITTMNVQDNMGVCPTSGGEIAGRIYTEHGIAISDAEVRVENMENAVMMTQTNGNYAFDVNGSANYTVIPSKNTNILNGVSTFDMVMITKHILGKEKFTSPYQYIAADVNASGEISTFDIIQMRKLILNLSTTFPNNQSWRFVDAGYDFTTENPAEEAFPELIQVNNLNGDIPDLDFIAVKIGDINGSASPNALVPADSRSKEGNMSILIADKLVKTGETVEVAFEVSDFKNIEGYQFALQFEGLSLEDFEAGIAAKSNFNFALQARGILMTSWHNTSGKANAATANLFRLKFKATTNGSLLSLLKIKSSNLAAEAYRNDGALLSVILQPKQSTSLSPEFNLEQNTPNPFAISTLINFELPSDATVVLNVLDMQGQVVQSQKRNFKKGLQHIEVQANGLPNGTYYYQLVSPFGVAAKKMIILK